MTNVTHKRERSAAGAGCGVRALLPEDFLAHRRAADRERLLSWRSLLDVAIERLEEEPERGKPMRLPRLLPEAFWKHRRTARREDLLAVRGLVDAFLGRLAGAGQPTQKATRVEVE